MFVEPPHHRCAHQGRFGQPPALRDPGHPAHVACIGKGVNQEECLQNII